MNRRSFFSTIAAMFCTPKVIRRPALVHNRIPDYGISIRHIRQFDARQGVWLDRCDALYGFGAEHVSNNVRVSA